MTAPLGAMPRPLPAHSPATPGAGAVRVERRHGRSADAGLDWAAEEVPVSLEYDGVSHAVMLASPVDLEDFAVGFSLSEGIVASASEILDLDVVPSDKGICVAMRLIGHRRAGLKRRRRMLAGTTGCGLCGMASLDEVVRPLPAVQGASRLSGGALARGFKALASGQPLMALTGATHAAGWLTPDGPPGPIREDIGRHNALDKLIGAMGRAGLDPSGGCALITSRASFEMVQKAVAAGITMLAAISAPTVMAIRHAEMLGLTLVGFARNGHCVVYSHGHRLGEGKGEDS